MKHIMQQSRSIPAVQPASRIQSLLQSRSELTVLIEAMEQDKTLRPPSWQLGSLRRELKGIEEMIKSTMSGGELPLRKLRHG